MPQLVVLANMPSRHNAELFGALAKRPEWDLHVIFTRRMTPGRQWTQLGPRDFPHTFLQEWRVHPHFYLNRGLFSALKRLRPDMLVVCQYAGIAMQMAMYWAWARSLPWVFWCERAGVEFTELPPVQSERLRVELRKIALLPVIYGPDEIWGVGTRATHHYQELSRVPCHNMPYYANFDRFVGIEREERPARMRLLMSGKLNARKGVDLVLTAVLRLIADGREFSISFMGDGPFKDEVMALVESHPEHVRYLGFKELDDIPDVLSEHDALICASRYDGWGLVVAESMAAGMPVLSTRATGAALDMIQDGHNGVLVDGNDADALYHGLVCLLEAQPRFDAMAVAARETAMDYTDDVGGAQMASRAAAVLARHRRHSA